MVFGLENISGIGKETKRKLEEANVDSVEKLASISVEDLLKLDIKGIGKVTAINYINNAKDFLKKSEKNPSAKDKEPSSRDVPKKSDNLKELMKQQAECNIGLVGHVDHGI